MVVQRLGCGFDDVLLFFVKSFGGQHKSEYVEVGVELNNSPLSDADLVETMFTASSREGLVEECTMALIGCVIFERTSFTYRCDSSLRGSPNVVENRRVISRLVASTNTRRILKISSMTVILLDTIHTAKSRTT